MDFGKLRCPPKKSLENLISNPRICASCRENQDGIYRCLKDEVQTSLEIWPPTFRVGDAISTILKKIFTKTGDFPASQC